jgi:hypothetical protein
MHDHHPGQNLRSWATFGVLAIIAFICAMRGAVTLANPGPQSPPDGGPSTPPAVVRLGTYDSRAVTVAYVRSEASARNLQALIQQRADAEKAGDRKRVKELNQQGEALQIRRHLQGFSNAPIQDILDSVRDRLPQVARDAQVVAIASVADWHDSTVELVDVTDALVALFEPDAQTLKIVQEVRGRAPEPIEVIAKVPARN